MSRWLLVLIIVLSGCKESTSDRSPDQTQPPTTQTRPDVDTLITDLMDMYDIPGASVALVQNGEILYTQGYGVRSTDTNEPVTPDTLFAIGSITKSFTALGVEELVESGQVNLNAPVMTYIPDFALSDPTATQQVTVRELLAQTSGLPGTFDSLWYSGQITTIQQATTYAASLPLAAAPGAVHIYSNYNFAIAGYLIEQVSGQTWPDYTRDHITQPLNMTSANFDIDAIQNSPNHAVPHRLDILEGMQPQRFVSLAGISSAGSINASANDMAQYLRFQVGNGDPLLSGAQMSEMHNLQAAYGPMPAPGPTGFQTKGYGFGWFIADYNGYTVLWHNGAIDGFYGMMMLLPSAQCGVVILSNAGVGNASLFTLAASLRLIEQMAGLEFNRDVVAALNDEADFDPTDRQSKLAAARSYQANPADWESWIGFYSGTYGTIQVTSEDNNLYLYLDTTPLHLIPFSSNGFLLANSPREGLISTFTFQVDENGQLALYQDGSKIGVYQGTSLPE